jgi:hypothetical protein
MTVPYPAISMGGVRDSAVAPSMRDPEIIGEEDSQLVLEGIEDEPEDDQDIKADPMIKEKKSNPKSAASTSGKRGGGNHK